VLAAVGRAAATGLPELVRATEDPDHDGQRSGRRGVGRPHAERQTVLAAQRIVHVGGWVDLRTDGPKRRRVARASPWRDRLRRLPAVVAGRRCGERDAQELSHARRTQAVDDSLVSRDVETRGDHVGRTGVLRRASIRRRVRAGRRTRRARTARAQREEGKDRDGGAR
jgi:hypothetical protein